jgi:GTP-binding protein EngB required for normal cell division
MSPDAVDPAQLNEFQKRRLRVTCEHIDKLLVEAEAVLNQSASKAAFPRYQSEIPLAQRRTIEGYIARIREQLLRILDGQNIEKPAPRFSPVQAIHVDLTFIEVAAEELYPKYMRGYGPVPEAVATDLNGIAGELLGLVSKLDRYVLAGVGEDLKKRFDHLEKIENEFGLLQKIEQIVSARGMVEYRPAIVNILDRAEDKRFEIAIFGRVSSGKSSLLNAIFATNILPVGVTPITAVPTRIVHGDVPRLTVWFADRPSQTFEISLLPEFAAEQGNPGNQRRVTRIVVELPATRLQDGVSFVDTPGLGSLATSGAAETLAYLPKCDLGVVLIDAGSTLTPDDIQTIQSLHEATVPSTILLSKADLLTAEDRGRIAAYVKEHLSKDCHVDLAVHPVSALESHHEMLDAWFEAEILPLYARCRELRSASLKRKIGALRDSVASSLNLLLRRGSGPPPVPPERVREVEARLRAANGRIEATLAAVEKETAKMSSEIREPVERASADLIESWLAKTDFSVPGAFSARTAIVQAIQSQVQELRREMESLAEGVWTDLISSAEVLEIPDRPNKEEFTSLVRGLPVFDAPWLDLQPARPLSLRFFGKRLAHSLLRRKLLRQCGPELEAALGIYAGLLRDSAENVLRQLRRHFESYADNYRAQAAAQHRAQTLTEGEEAKIRADLKLLEAPTFPNGLPPSGSQVQLVPN